MATTEYVVQAEVTRGEGGVTLCEHDKDVQGGRKQQAVEGVPLEQAEKLVGVEGIHSGLPNKYVNARDVWA